MHFVDSAVYRILKARGFSSCFRNTKGGVIHSLEKRVDQEKEVIVLVHGVGANAAHYARIMFPLQRAGYSILALDLLSHGYSEDPGKEVSSDRLFEAFSDWLNQVQTEKLILVGNSLGGALSLRYSVLFPERVKKLILISPAGGFESGEEWEEFKKDLQFKSKADSLSYLGRIYHQKPFYLSWFAQSFFEMMSKASIQKLVEEGKFEEFELSKTGSDLSKIFPPTLLIWGRSEKIFPKKHLEWFKKNLPSSVIFDETKAIGHCPQVESARWLWKRMDRFMQAGT